jgi:hypothetical protein
MAAYRYPRILEDRYIAFRQILPESASDRLSS